MAGVRCITVSLVAAAVLLVAFAAAASAAPPIYLAGAKDKHGPYSKGVTPVTANHSRDVFVRVKSNGLDHEVALFDKRLGDGLSDIKVRYYRGNDNITHDVRTGGGYGFDLSFGDPVRFRITLTPTVQNPGQLCVYPYGVADDDPTEYYTYFAVNNPSACV